MKKLLLLSAIALLSTAVHAEWKRAMTPEVLPQKTTVENATKELKDATDAFCYATELPADYSSFIVNNNFDPQKGNRDEKRIDGWEVEGALNGYKLNTCSFNKGTFKLSQTIENLPEGFYKVTVHTFYRAGDYSEEEANINAGKDTHLMKLFADTGECDYETDIMNLSEGSFGEVLPEGISTKTINGITVPDGTAASVKCFETGLFLNELLFEVSKDGCVTIGLKLDETIGTNDYSVVGQWNLYYLGTEITELDTRIDTTERVAPTTPVEFYTPSGKRISSPQPGINIIKMSDGSVKKVRVN